METAGPILPNYSNQCYFIIIKTTTTTGTNAAANTLDPRYNAPRYNADSVKMRLKSWIPIFQD